MEMEIDNTERKKYLVKVIFRTANIHCFGRNRMKDVQNGDLTGF